MKKLVRLSLTICVSVLGLALCRCAQNTPATSWKLVYQNDLNGETLYGNRETLCELVKDGSPIRVSWGEMLEDGRICVEFAEPNFTTLMSGPELVVQFPVSMIQTDYLDSRKAFLNTKTPTEWRALMSTDGHYHQFHLLIGSTKINRVMYLRARMSWYAFTSRDINSPQEQSPLDTKGGIVLDSVSRID